MRINIQAALKKNFNKLEIVESASFRETLFAMKKSAAFVPIWLHLMSVGKTKFDA